MDLVSSIFDGDLFCEKYYSALGSAVGSCKDRKTGAHSITFLKIKLTSVGFEAYQTQHTCSIDNPTTVSTVMWLLTQELTTCIFTPKKDATTIDTPIYRQIQHELPLKKATIAQPQGPPD
jgi:hypothetical protein